MRTAMLPLVDVVRSDWLLADKSVDTALTTITDVFDFYSRDLVMDSGHAPIIGQTSQVLNPRGRIPKADTQNLIIRGSNVPEPVIEILIEAAGNRHVWWLEFDWNDRREERQHWACWRDSARFRVFQGWAASRISFFYWWNKGNRVLILPILFQRADSFRASGSHMQNTASQCSRLLAQFNWLAAGLLPGLLSGSGALTGISRAGR
jgi:hypothetical protein